MLCEHSIVMNQKISDVSANHYKNPLPHPEFIVRRCGSGFFILYLNTLPIRQSHFDSSLQVLLPGSHADQAITF